jgi:hypothetical protein
MTEILSKIKSRGYWIIRILPETSDERVQTLKELEDAVRSCGVDLRGWDFPHYDYSESPVRHTHYIEQSVDWQGIVEFWRAYKSGQFFSFSSLYGEWDECSAESQGLDEAERSKWLSVEDSIFRFTEILEFASRWAAALSFSGKIVVSCTLNGLGGRVLQLSLARRGLMRRYVSTQDGWRADLEFDTATLLSAPRDLAVDPAIRLLEIFGLDIANSTVKDIQAGLRS